MDASGANCVSMNNTVRLVMGRLELHLGSTYDADAEELLARMGAT